MLADVHVSAWQMDDDEKRSKQAGSGDPGLVDLQKQDYQLKADSPLRGKAINLSEFYKTDFDGRPLPKTGNWDIGAIQYNTTKPTEVLQPKLSIGR